MTQNTLFNDESVKDNVDDLVIASRLSHPAWRCIINSSCDFKDIYPCVAVLFVSTLHPFELAIYRVKLFISM